MLLKSLTERPAWALPFGPAIDLDFLNGRWYGGHPLDHITTSNFRLTVGSGLQSLTSNSDVYNLKGRALKILSTFNFTALVSGSGSSSGAVGVYLLDFDNDSANNPMLLTGATPTRISTFPGTLVNGTLGSGTYAGAVKGVVASAPSGTSLVGNGGTVVTTANSFSAITFPCLGGTSTANQQYNGFITRLTIWSRKLDDAKIRQLST